MLEGPKRFLLTKFKGFPVLQIAYKLSLIQTQKLNFIYLDPVPLWDGFGRR